MRSQLFFQKKINQFKKGLPSIVFLHGACSSSEVWDPILRSQQWGEDYNLYAPDFPGHGKSERSNSPSLDYTIGGLAEILAEWISEQEELDQYILVGNSLASNIIAEALPLVTSCKGTFLISVSVLGGEIGLANAIQPNPNLGLVFQASATETELDAWATDALYEPTTEKKSNLIKSYLNTDPKFRMEMGQSVQQSVWKDEISILCNQNFPIGIVYGDNERFLKIDYLSSTKIPIWKEAIQIVHNASHLVPIDQPEILVPMINEYAMKCFGGQ